MIFEIGLAKHHVRFHFTPTNARVVLHSISQIKPRLFVPGGVVNPRNSGAILAAMIVVKSTGCSSTTTRTAKPTRGPWTRASCPCGMCTSRHQGLTAGQAAHGGRRAALRCAGRRPERARASAAALAPWTSGCSPDPGICLGATTTQRNLTSRGRRRAPDLGRSGLPGCEEELILQLRVGLRRMRQRQCDRASNDPISAEGRQSRPAVEASPAIPPRRP